MTEQECLVELPQTTPAPVNLLSVTNSDGPAFNTRRQIYQCLSMDTSTVQPDVMPEISTTPDPMPNITDSRQIRNGKAPQHEMDLFIPIRG